MRTLFRFFQKHYTFFLFLLLEGIAIFLLVQNNYIQRISFVRATGSFSGRVYEQVSTWREYVHLNEINRQLLEENTTLRNRLSEAFYDLDSSRVASFDSLYFKKYSILYAEVINSTVNKQYNFITLNKGRRQGIKVNMAVTCPDGIVGIIHGVSEHFATVLPVINRNFRVSTKFKKNNFYGSLTWDGRSYRHALLNEIPLHAPVAIGDTLVVSGYSDSFPEGISVGIVDEFSKKDGNFYAIKVLLSTDFRKLFYVSVIEDHMKEEQDLLEQQISGDQ
ncbi:MAG: rod shape-determining protein MreC [Bacteroidales bacterium]|jgi:rod shape-determining protein MreC|nr:rod shape-determining protein MreC [Bacteroidales bacterium]